MPKLNGKHYAYTKKGYAAYKRAKKKKRRSLTVRKGFKEYEDALKDRGEDPKIRTIKTKKKHFKISKTYFSK